MPGSRGDSFIPEHSGGQIVFREFTRLNALDSTVVPNTADVTALRGHVTIPVPVFPVRSDASIIRGRADSNVPSSPPCHSLDHDSSPGPWRTSPAKWHPNFRDGKIPSGKESTCRIRQAEACPTPARPAQAVPVSRTGFSLSLYESTGSPRADFFATLGFSMLPNLAAGGFSQSVRPRRPIPFVRRSCFRFGPTGTSHETHIWTAAGNVGDLDDERLLHR
jgi:hypothetical protein